MGYILPQASNRGEKLCSASYFTTIKIINRGEMLLGYGFDTQLNHEQKIVARHILPQLTDSTMVNSFIIFLNIFLISSIFTSFFLILVNYTYFIP